MYILCILYIEFRLLHYLKMAFRLLHYLKMAKAANYFGLTLEDFDELKKTNAEIPEEMEDGEVVDTCEEDKKLEIQDDTAKSSPTSYEMVGMLLNVNERLDKIEAVLGLQLDGMKEKPKCIAKENMLLMIQEAIQLGNADYGVSKKFIKKHLFEHFMIPNSAHYCKKLNACIQCGLDRGLFKFDSAHQLFKI